ncbi:MAG: peptide chain release factor N(5)-glutamine methyltransferase, partial [Anaerolineae bacterium]|nr:peptide chain release factor N(5)-glutamine methyltransferase [Anaerolineae bacterium]
LVAERAKGNPMAYLLGYQGFYDIEVNVTPDVLIPRPETEMLVEKALQWASERPHNFIVDVGTGSGIIALTLAKHLRNAHITAIDISQTALQVARSNGELLGLDHRVRWLQGDLLQPMIQMRDLVDLIVANLPYIQTHELEQLEVAKYEPIIALNGGQDGLDYFRRLLADARLILRPKGCILLEIGATQAYSVSALAGQAFPDAKITIDKDLAQHDRVVSVQL